MSSGKRRHQECWEVGTEIALVFLERVADGDASSSRGDELLKRADRSGGFVIDLGIKESGSDFRGDFFNGQGVVFLDELLIGVDLLLIQRGLELVEVWIAEEDADKGIVQSVLVRIWQLLQFDGAGTQQIA